MGSALGWLEGWLEEGWLEGWLEEGWLEEGLLEEGWLEEGGLEEGWLDGYGAHSNALTTCSCGHVSLHAGQPTKPDGHATGVITT